ncbi:hypothetical protein [Rheinheimera nanhaiensis]|uniref:hypothetical protein n=1 Tax=Rheinheimera nanhaiensis TaxID=1163621 RepID=UPI00058C2E0F|nr:hypothetical protein [Rheinheimera nanhaiensis]
MRFDSFLIELVATPAYLLTAFIVVLVICHLVLIKFLKLSAVAWKRVDYIWLSMAAFGLFATSSQVDQYLSGQLLQNLEIPRAESDYRLLRRWVDDAAKPESSICIVRERSDFSPDDFDDIVHEQRSQCSYFKSLNTNMPSSVSYPLKPLVELGYVQYLGTTNYESFYVETLEKYASEYEEQRDLVLSRALSVQTSTFEFLMMVFGPLLLCLALALRITKVTAEIQVEKKKLKMGA